MARTAPAPTNPKLYRVLTHAEETAPVRTLTLRDMLNQGSFRLALNARQQQGQRGQRGQSKARSPWALWGRGNARGFKSSPEGLTSLEGNAYSGWLGLDYTRGRFLGGLAVSYDETHSDYRTDEGTSGTVTTRLGTVYPYARYGFLNGKAQLWALTGFGGGTLELEAEGETMTTDVELQMLAFGVKGDVLELYGVNLAIKSDAAFSHFATRSITNLPTVRSKPQRLRTALEARYPWRINAESELTPSVELGGRLDLNSSVNGAGLEMAGGVLYSNRALRLDLDARARGLLTHRVSGVEEWGVSFLARVNPDGFGFGWFASIIPNWGRTQSGAARLWESQTLDWQQSPVQDIGWQPDRIDAELGYGFGLAGRPGIVSPFAKVSAAQRSSQSIGLGARFDLPRQPLRLEVLGERVTSPSAAAPVEHRIGLQFRMNF